MALRLATSLNHFDIARRNEVAEFVHTRLIIFTGQLERFRGELSQLNEVGVLEGLDVDVCVHGPTIAKLCRAGRDGRRTIARLRRVGHACSRNAVHRRTAALSY